MTASPFARSLAATLLALSVAATGCVHYVPLTDGLPSAGDEVRIRPTPEAGPRIMAQVGRDATVLEGRMVGLAAAGDSLRVVVPLGDVWTRVGPDTPRGTVALHPIEIVGLERKELSRSRTALVGVAVGVVVVSFFRSVSGDRNRPNRGGEEDIEPPPVDLFCLVRGAFGGSPGHCGG